MQMTSRGEGRLCEGGSPVYFFHSANTPSSFLLSLGVTAGVGNLKGENKNELAVQPASTAASDATPLSKGIANGAARGMDSQIDSTIFNTSATLLNTTKPCSTSC